MAAILTLPFNHAAGASSAKPPADARDLGDAEPSGDKGARVEGGAAAPGRMQQRAAWPSCASPHTHAALVHRPGQRQS